MEPAEVAPMNKGFIPPSTALLETWDKGAPLTDTQLDELEQFFFVMVKGTEALGQRYSLATMALRAEWERADRTKRYRGQAIKIQAAT